MDHLCYICLVFVILSRLFIAALWSAARKGLASWLLFVMFIFAFVTFPCGILGQVPWYLIVSIPDLCRLSCICYHQYQLFGHHENKLGTSTDVNLSTVHPASVKDLPNIITLMATILQTQFGEREKTL